MLLAQMDGCSRYAETQLFILSLELSMKSLQFVSINQNIYFHAAQSNTR